MKDIWDTYEHPCANIEADNDNQAKVLVCFANILDIDLSAGEEINRRKLIDKLVDWTAHVYREDANAFNNIVNIGKDFDGGFLRWMLKKRGNGKIMRNKSLQIQMQCLLKEAR